MRGYVFDLDGTVYLGDQMIDGAAEVIRILKNRGDRVVFLTNKPIATRQSYVAKLNKMGIPATLNEVLNSSLIVASWLSRNMKKDEKVFVIGEKPIHQELEFSGIPLTHDSENAEYIILSWDRQFNYDKLNMVLQAALKGAFIIASNPDPTCPLKSGQVPDTGALIAALEAAAGKSIDLIAGKPSIIAAEAAMSCLGLHCKDSFMVGDRLETDIRMANASGMASVLVLTGVSTIEMAKHSADRPKHIIPSIKEIVNL